MIPAEYKILFDGSAATREQLDRFENLVVEQEEDRPWQARLEMSICLDDQGNWSNDDEEFMHAFTRVRVELKVGDGAFQPLIDGPLVGHDSDRSSWPGSSTLTLVVHDDGALLHRATGVEAYPPGTADSAIARRVFGEYPEIATTMIEDTPDAPAALPPEPRRRGTHMELLRRLARRNDLVCAVVPGDAPGASIGVFHSTPVFTEEPAPLVLLGPERNIDRFDVQLNAQGPANVVASTLSFSDKSTVTRRSQVRDVQLIGERPAVESEADAGEQMLRPGTGEDADLQHRVDREARRNSRAFEATGTVRGGCYDGVLRPFHRVQVKLGTTATSGTYVIRKVVHRVTRSEYTQEFTLVTDSLSDTAASSSLVPPGVF
jgi:phage protein D